MESSNIVIVVFMIIIIFLIIIDILFFGNKRKNNNVSQYQQQPNQQPDDSFAYEQMMIQSKRHRNHYWKTLGNIYDRQSNETLKKARITLELMENYYHNESSINIFSVNNFDGHEVDRWYEKLGELRALLHEPTWEIDISDNDKFDLPLYYDLDISYIDDLLNERANNATK